MRAFHYLFSTFLGTGYFPKAPGTAGSFAGLIVFWFFPAHFELQISLLIILFSIGVWSATYVELQEGADPGKVVIDEVVGQGIAILFIPKTIWLYLLAFISFRTFDILKPFPIKHIERLPAGWGIMSDDVMAGIYANIMLQVILFSGLLS